VDMANEAGGRDNISVLLVRIAEADEESEPWNVRDASDATRDPASSVR
jgi:serine/threonine protein phosphatase PrpC